MSDLHRQNLEEWRRQSEGASSSSALSASQYRDRAKERRQKYGGAAVDDDAPRPNKLKEKYLAAMQEADSTAVSDRSIGESNIGNKMLQKMGWKEGLGLGKANQGRTSIIEVVIAFEMLISFLKH